MLRSHFSALAALSLSLMLAGCAGTAINLSDFPEDTTADMEKAARMPSKETLERSRSRARVVVLKVDNADGNSKANRELNDAFGREVEAALVKKGVEIVDSSLAGRLDQEIKACEMQGKAKCGSNLAPSVAQFAIKPTVTNASYSQSTVAEQQMRGGDAQFVMLASSYGDMVTRLAVDGVNDILVVKPHMLHSAKVSTTVKVYEIPSLRELKAVTGSSGEQKQRTALGMAQVESSMLVNALGAAVPTPDDMAEVANLFAPKGFVTGRRTGPKKPIFRVSVGTGQGVREGMKVMIANERENENPITGAKTIDLVDVVHGYVSSIVTEDEAWVIPDDEEKAKKVALGDRVVIKHDVNAFEKFRSNMQKLSQ